MPIINNVQHTIKPVYSQKIPFKIFQTWKTSHVDDKMYNAVQSVIQSNPEYDYYFYTDDMCRKFILEHYGEMMLYAFDVLIPGAFKADLWRYCALWVYGGIYVDIDMIQHVPFKKFIDKDDEIILVWDNPIKEYYKFGIFQAFIATVPQNQIIKDTLDRCYDNIIGKYHGKNSLDITGPIMMGKVITKDQDKSLKLGYNIITKQNKTYSFRLLHHKAPNIYDENNKLIFNTKYDGYKNTAQDYTILFRNGKLYKDNFVTIGGNNLKEMSRMTCWHHNSIGSSAITYMCELNDKRIIAKKTRPEYKHMYETEKRFLAFFKNLNNSNLPVPILYDVNDDEYIIFVNDCGKAMNTIDTNEWPSDYNEQLKAINDFLKRYHIQHNDIALNNILIKDDKLTLIDFGRSEFINPDTRLEYFKDNLDTQNFHKIINDNVKWNTKSLVFIVICIILIVILIIWFIKRYKTK